MPHMPTYECFFESNGPTVEVSHRMSELLQGLSALCQRIGTACARSTVRSPPRWLIAASAVPAGKGASTEMQAANCDVRPVGRGVCGWAA